MDERWIELESRIAFQDRTIERLSEELLDHERRIEELSGQLRELVRRWSEGRAENAEGESP